MKKLSSGIHLAKVFCYVAFAAIFLCVGCGSNDRGRNDEGQSTTQVEISFRHKLEGLVAGLDGNENCFRQSAYGLCCDIRNESELNVRRRLLTAYTNAVNNLSVDISLDSLDDEKRLNVIEVRLRNSWHFSEWGTAALFDFDPANSEGWNFLTAGALRWRNALTMIDTKTHQDSIKAQWRKRLYAFKRHLSSMYESKVWGLGKTYWSLRHKMTPEQRQEVRKNVMEALGELPLEMAKDETERLTKDTESK